MTVGRLEVGVQIDGRTAVAGTAHFVRRGRSLSTTFTYRPAYLTLPNSYALDPDLDLVLGPLHTDGLPRAFADCAPDRWGRNLIQKRIRAQAAQDRRTQPAVDDTDYLVGVSDLTRQGALRFRPPGTEDWLATDRAVPKLIELPALLRASDRLSNDPDDLEAIKVLLGAGTGTLGGARPKASVRDGERLLVAKFPKPTDEWDVIAWEATALDIAERAGVIVPRRRLIHVDGRAVLLLDRFDRITDTRIGYWSAMTLLGAADRQSGDYVDFAEALAEVGVDTAADLRQLWRRIALSVVIHNTDDHLRNHGLLRQGSGWRLSPAFDINPNPNVNELRSTTIGGAAPNAEIDALMTYAPNFGLDRSTAGRTLDEVRHAARSWRNLAAANGVPASHLGRFADTFDADRH
ncbi:MAG TPA: HipA domain-containing protein [Microlunatus sp.]